MFCRDINNAGHPANRSHIALSGGKISFGEDYRNVVVVRPARHLERQWDNSTQAAGRVHLEETLSRIHSRQVFVNNLHFCDAQRRQAVCDVRASGAVAEHYHVHTVNIRKLKELRGNVPCMQHLVKQDLARGPNRVLVTARALRTPGHRNAGFLPSGVYRQNRPRMIAHLTALISKRILSILKGPDA